MRCLPPLPSTSRYPWSSTTSGQVEAAQLADAQAATVEHLEHGAVARQPRDRPPAPQALRTSVVPGQSTKRRAGAPGFSAAAALPRGCFRCNPRPRKNGESPSPPTPCGTPWRRHNPARTDAPDTPRWTRATPARASRRPARTGNPGRFPGRPRRPRWYAASCRARCAGRRRIPPPNRSNRRYRCSRPLARPFPIGPSLYTAAHGKGRLIRRPFRNNNIM